MDKDVAVYLDLDNVTIGALEANVNFDINLVMEYVEALTNGRIALRRAYGDWRQRAYLTKELATAGFELKSTVRLSTNSKNLADMQMVVDAMTTLVDGQDYCTYVLITGDRDFSPLVQELRKRGKQVIGAGLKHASSQHLVHLCDHFIYYDELAAAADQMLDEQLADLLQRALEQLLQDKVRVPASLLKQRVQALSKGTFGRSPQGKSSFSKILTHYPHIVQVEQEGTTLYVRRPGASPPRKVVIGRSGRQLSDDEARELLERALDELIQDDNYVRASLLKQRMQDLSNGDFDETLQGDKSFRKFLDRHRDLVAIEQEGSTLYVGQGHGSALPVAEPTARYVSANEARDLLQAALDDLMVDQIRVRASLLKQRMQELSDGAFDEERIGDQNFRQFLERYPALIQVQQKGTTLYVLRPDSFVEPEDLNLHYRSALKKKGLRVVPSATRLQILQDIVTLLKNRPQTEWRQLVNQLAAYYQRAGKQDISKSFVNDVLRVARRAEVISVANGGNLANAAVTLRVSGDRAFQDAVILCDVTYLREIQNLDLAFNLDQVSIALYESVSHARYLKVILNRFPENGKTGK